MLAPFEQYLVDCIEQGEGDVYCLGKVGRKVKWAYDRFVEEYGWRIPKVGREQAMTEWLQGLCPSVRLVFTNYDVAQLRKEWNVSEREYDWVAGWFKRCAIALIRLHDRYVANSMSQWYRQTVDMTGTEPSKDSVRKWIADNKFEALHLDKTSFVWAGTNYSVIVSLWLRETTPEDWPSEDIIKGYYYNITQHN
jgi:hypothetical protein